MSKDLLPSWQPYQPSAEHPWDLRRVVHLHRRAGFAATWAEIQRDLADGPEAAVGRLLKGQARLDGVPDDFHVMAQVLGDAAVGSGNPNRLKAWWLYRMLFTPDPLTERLVLLWHNHFATSNLKVADVGLMRRQNDLFREFARAPFAETLRHAAKDPALLIWLDADANRKEHPNENLAREIMELFTLGVGNYTETDIREAARALTGWSVRNGRFRRYDQFHDPDQKVVFGRAGNWDGDDLVRLLLEHPATARRLAFRICEWLMGEQTVDAQGLEQLANGLRERELDVGWAVEQVLRSESFFGQGNVGNRILAPVEFVLGAARALEMFAPPPSTLLLAEWTARLGQDLFYPPNVFGWPGGRSWITSRSLIARTNFATSLVSGNLRNPAEPFNGTALAQKHGREKDDPRGFYEQLLLGHSTPPTTESRPIIEGAVPPGSADTGRVIASILASPAAQLG